MKCRNLVCALWLAVALHVSWCREKEGHYTNKFFVLVNGDIHMATSIAEYYGMKNLGQVSTLHTSVFVPETSHTLLSRSLIQQWLHTIHTHVVTEF